MTFPSFSGAGCRSGPAPRKGKNLITMKTLRWFISCLALIILAASCAKVTRDGDAPVVTITADNSFYKDFGAFYLHLNGDTERDVRLSIRVSQPEGLILDLPGSIAIRRGCAFTTVPVGADPSDLAPGIYTVTFRIQDADGAEVGEPSSADILLIVPEKH